MNKHVLEVTDLSVDYTDTDGNTVHAVRGISFHVDKGEILGMIGSSGSGKSTALSALMGVLSFRARMTGGKIVLNGRSLSGEGFASRKEHQRFLQRIRGREIAMVFQKPENYMDPTMRIESQLIETGTAHKDIGIMERKKYALSLLARTGITDRSILKRVPAELSGGQIQKIAIAMAIAHDPAVLLADEPFSSLDAESRRQMRQLFRQMADDGTAIILSAHDLMTAEELCDRLIVLDEGEIIEEGTAEMIMKHPEQPYTKELISIYRLIGKGESDEETV